MNDLLNCFIYKWINVRRQSYLKRDMYGEMVILIITKMLIIWSVRLLLIGSV